MTTKLHSIRCKILVQEASRNAGVPAGQSEISGPTFY